MTHVMLDLETMGTDFKAPIIAIGAVKFDARGLWTGPGSEFYLTVDLQSAVDTGAIVDPRTIVWWMQQPDEARKSVTREGAVKLTDALDAFEAWLPDGVDLSGIWGNGANFDNAILGESYRRTRRSIPWPFWKDRCFRTMKSVFPYNEPGFEGTKHNALHDAKHQARILLDINKEMGFL